MSAPRLSFIGALLLSFGLGVGVAFIASGSPALAAELRAAQWSLESATRTNAELAGELRQLHSELERASGIAKEQQSIIDGQKRVIDGIAETIGKQGGDLRGQIRAIADGFRRLYAFYNQGTK